MKRQIDGWIKGIPAAASHCGTSTRLIHTWIRRGYLEPRRLSQRLLLFRASQLDECIERIADDFEQGQV